MDEKELFTRDELEEYMREEVADAGGAKKWLRRNGLYEQFKHIEHMVANGGAATIPGMLDRLGFESVSMFRPIKPKQS